MHWTAPGAYRTRIGDVSVALSLDDLSGRINPNTATPALMGALLEAAGLAGPQAAALGEAIVAWRSPAEVPSPSSRVRGRPFDTIDDLGALPGMTPALLAKLAPDLTLWWYDNPEPAAAPSDVLRALRILGDVRPLGIRIRQTVQAIGITATAVGPAGGRFTRHADAVLNTAARRSRWRIVSWGEPAAD